MCSSSGGYSCTYAAYGTVTLYESSWCLVGTQFEWRHHNCLSYYVTHVKLYEFDDQEFKPLTGTRNFSHPKNAQMGSRSNQPPIGATSPGVKWLEHKADHTPSTAEIKNLRTYSSTLPYALSHAQGQFYILQFTMLHKAEACHISFIVCMHSWNKRIKRSQEWELPVHSMKHWEASLNYLEN